MIAAPLVVAGGRTARPSVWPAGETSPGQTSPIRAGSFGAAMASIDRPRALSAAGSVAAAPSRESALGALALQLDEIGRQRVEAQALSGALAGARAEGMSTEVLAITMHRQARAMANYNIGVMWTAKLVGVTAGALRQLTASS